ncbi:hypothetical protein COM81_26520, partial [Priestia megaterium]
DGGALGLFGPGDALRLGEGLRVHLDADLVRQLGGLREDPEGLLQPDGVPLRGQVLAAGGPRRHQVDEPEDGRDEQDDAATPRADSCHANTVG